MPKRVDHSERRREIAAAVARIAASRGLGDVSFREVATEAGVSVALVQHYFGNRRGLLMGTLEIHSDGMGRRIRERAEALGAAPRPLEIVRAVASAFLPTDAESRAVMLVYHAFAAAALADASLRSAEAFADEGRLREILADQLGRARDAGEVDAGVDPGDEARVIVALILGLSLTVLLGQMTAPEAERILDAHLASL